MSKNLLPCPFCGGEAEPIQELPMQHRAYIICSDHNCWGHMKVEWGTMDDKDKFIKRLIDNWNRRAERWIPVSERLPNLDETGYSYVMVSMDDEFVSAADYTKGDGWGLWADSGEVIAWQPLPEPYKEDAK